MHAWTKSGNSAKHPEPWGIYGAFSTLRIQHGSRILFPAAHFDRLHHSAKKLNLPWIPSFDLLNSRIIEVLKSLESEKNHLLRICLFEDLLGISIRPALSDGNPVEGWLLSYRRPEPSIKCTAEKELYGSLSDLNIGKEDWIIHDPKENELRESATSNLIFVKGSKLVIPEKKILQGITLQKILPNLRETFSISREIPHDEEIKDYSEILLCGTGRGIAPISSIPELGWKSQGNEIFNEIRAIYENLIETADAGI